MLGYILGDDCGNIPGGGVSEQLQHSLDYVVAVLVHDYL